MNIGRAIKHFRLARGGNQTQLAKDIGLTRAYLSMIESGARIPPVDTVERIATALRITVFVLYFVASDEADLRFASKDLIASLSVEAMSVVRQPHDQANQNPNEDRRRLVRPVNPSA